MDNNERYVQYATWSASNTMWIVDIGWSALSAGLVLYILYCTVHTVLYILYCTYTVIRRQTKSLQ